MKPHLIFIDIDGTLIRDDQTLSIRTKKVIEKLQQMGHIVYIATGRMRLQAESVQKLINKNVRLINSNGAMYDLNNVTEIEKFGADAIKEVMEIINKYPVSVRFFTPDHVYHNVSNKKELSAISFVVNMLKKNEISFFKNVSDINVNQVTNGLITDGKQINFEVVKKLLSESKMLDISSSSPENIELLPKGINKASAVKKIQHYYGIDFENTIVFGNGENDISMLQQAKISVAMENSTPLIFKYANYVTLSNENDGVADFLNNYFELNM